MNTIKIRLEQDIVPEAFWKITLLRKARKIGDKETINNTQLGRLSQLGINFRREGRVQT